MKYDPKVESELLEILENDPTGEGVDFSRHDEIQRAGYSVEVRNQLLTMQNLTSAKAFHLQRMVNQGFVEYLRDWSSADSSRYRITAAGSALTVEEKLKTWTRFRSFIRALKSISNEIIIKILVAVLAAIAIALLGF